MEDGQRWITVHSQDTTANFSGFLKALDVWVEKPHVVNRRLTGALIVRRTSLESLRIKDLETFLILDQVEFLEQDTGVRTAKCEELKLKKNQQGKDTGIEKIDNLERDGKDYLMGPADRDCEGKMNDILVLRKLLPRQLHKQDAMLELVILEKRKRRMSFFPLRRPLHEGQFQVSHDWLNNSESYCFLYEESLLCSDEQHARVSLQVLGTGIADDTKRDGVLCPTIQWLQEHLLPKLCKWAVEIQPDGKKRNRSLRLVPLDQYTLLYHRLKQQYGEKLVKMWPERTDPQKFVYEDIAIAAYLLILWKEERKTHHKENKQSFVDLGCGNGLLVYILGEEGHPGFGIDVRRRKIWDFYGGNTDLQERALDPTVAGLFPDVDWLIGNHSDELTPWIPVMAARSSYMTRYFVLPCCFFDFNCKFVRKANKVTQYRGYLDFVHEVGERCGFHVEEDSLRIPSTKRICQIGRMRIYSKDTHHLRESVIKEMISKRGCDIDAGNIPETLIPASGTQTLHDEQGGQYVKEKTSFKSCEQTEDQILENGHQQHTAITSEVTDSSIYNGDNACKDSSNSCSSNVAVPTFQPRPTKEPMRNCTTLNRSLKEFIVNTVARNLLSLPLNSDKGHLADSASGVTDSQATVSRGIDSVQWRMGGKMKLSEVAELFDKSTLLQLKNECGGLQTLLRNHYYIFKVTGGVVQMRDWTQETPGPRGKKGDLARKQRRSQALWKTSLCWFYLQHPDGCPVAVQQCPFAHGEHELRERPTAEFLDNL